LKIEASAVAVESDRGTELKLSISAPDNEPKGCRAFAGKIVATLFFGVFFAMGLLFLVILIGETYRDLATWRWNPTPCTILTSGVAQTESDNPYTAEITYAYSVEEREYVGSRVTRSHDGSSNYEKAQRRVLTYPAGSAATCYVNPARPEDSVLERSRPWLALMILLPLVFVAVGAGGLYVVWRGARAPGPVGTESISRQAGGARGRRVALAVGWLFIVIGLVIFAAVFLRPAVRLVRASSWNETPCRVVSSAVRSHTSDDGTTYSVDILYEYEFSGHTLRSNRYGFLGGSSSGYDGKRAIVDRYPPGTEATCWVDPDDPAMAVLDRSFQLIYLVGLFPLVFVVIGWALVAHMRKQAPRAACGTTATGATVEPESSGPLELEPQVSPLGKLFGMVLFACIWNGIVSVFVWQVVSSWRSGHPDWTLTIFMIPFVLVGLALLGGVGYTALALVNPRPHLTLTPGHPRLGDDLRVEWRLSGRVSRIRHLRIVLKGREEATYQRGTDTVTDKKAFAAYEVVDTGNDWEIGRGAAEVMVPEDTMHSFSATHNKIVWTLEVKGEIQRWPDVDDAFPITILPLPPEPLP
jgi:hypothetical protein